MRANAFSLALLAAMTLEKVSGQCKNTTTVSLFDQEEFISKKWYAIQQRPTPFNPSTQNFCVTAQYELLDPTDPAAQLGYAIKVFNTAQDIDGNLFTSDDEVQAGPAPGPLCAAPAAFPGDRTAEVTVGQCFLPPSTFGQSNYWVVAYDERDGYALISGGQPTVPTRRGLCSFPSPFNGLWIFARSPKRDREMIRKYRKIARKNGIDPKIMESIEHGGCRYPGEEEEKSEKSKKSEKRKKKKKGSASKERGETKRRKKSSSES